jgi:hypothetical protein
MCPAEFYAAVQGYVRTHSTGEPSETAPSEADYIRILAEEKMMGRA